jgi:hypothetical protein
LVTSAVSPLLLLEVDPMESDRLEWTSGEALRDLRGRWHEAGAETGACTSTLNLAVAVTFVTWPGVGEDPEPESWKRFIIVTRIRYVLKCNSNSGITHLVIV